MAPRVKVLEVRGLRVQRGARALLRDVSFDAVRGDVTALMGASGAGKTTVLRAIAGLDAIANGTITVDGVRLTARRSSRGDLRDLHRRVGIVFQFHHLFAHMTALQNVCLAPVHVVGVPRVEAERRARDLLAQLGVADREEAMPHELSGGEAQRVAIARALAVEPPVLLMDEPTASLDPARRGELASTLRRLAADGRTLLIATHDADFARACARRVVIIEGGTVTRDGAAAELLA
jgi:ABC-type polar amino acid transport system ATPase subunit